MPGGARCQAVQDARRCKMPGGARLCGVRKTAQNCATLRPTMLVHPILIESANPVPKFLKRATVGGPDCALQGLSPG